MKGIVCTIALALAATTCFAGALAGAEEPPSPRAEYVAQVEPICEANTLASKRILENVRVKARSKDPDAVREAGGQFLHAAAAFGSTVSKIATVPPPPEDEVRLHRWIERLRIVQANLRHLGKALQRLQ
jgi:hypothetical protein